MDTFWVPVVNADGTVTGDVTAVPRAHYMDVEHKLSLLKYSDFARLRDLEDEIFMRGVDDGESTGEAIDALEDLERRLGVYYSCASGIRWRDYNESLRRLDSY